MGEMKQVPYRWPTILEWRVNLTVILSGSELHNLTVILRGSELHNLTVILRGSELHNLTVIVSGLVLHSFTVILSGLVLHSLAVIWKFLLRFCKVIHIFVGTDKKFSDCSKNIMRILTKYSRPDDQAPRSVAPKSQIISFFHLIYPPHFLAFFPLFSVLPSLLSFFLCTFFSSLFT
jgi:hypothetical protein